MPAAAYDERLHEWQAREAMARGDWRSALAAIRKMGPDQRNDPRWRYFEARLAETEQRNLRLYGYGIKGFTLSMIETAMELTNGEAPPHVVREILAAGAPHMSSGMYDDE